MTPPDPVTALGYVDPPPPDVLDAAREALWSAVTHEMLTTDPAAAQTAACAEAAEPPPAGRQSIRPAGRSDAHQRPFPAA